MQMQRTTITYLTFVFIALSVLPTLLAQEQQKTAGNTVPMPMPFATLDTLPYTLSGADTVYMNNFRHADCSLLDLRNHFKLLLSCEFDTKTIWPPQERIPEYFRPDFIKVFSSNPGCNVRSAAKAGFMGLGKRIVVVGPPPLLHHSEYGHRIASYRTFGEVSDTATVDGTAWMSIIAGRTTGIAFDTQVHYFAVPHHERDGVPYYNGIELASALKATEKLLTSDDKPHAVTALVLPYDIDGDGPQTDQIIQAIELLRERGLAVITSKQDVLGEDTRIVGIGREPLRNPEDYLFWRPAQYWYGNVDSVLASPVPTLFLPLDSRVLAAPTGWDDYALYRSPSPRWLAPYLAACFTLAAEASPGLTLHEFFNAAKDTGVIVKFAMGSTPFELTHVLHLLDLINLVAEDR